jgi:general secretion pathway protein D
LSATVPVLTAATLLATALWVGTSACYAQAPASQPDTKPAATTTGPTTSATTAGATTESATGPAATTGPATEAASTEPASEPATQATTEATTQPTTEPTTRVATTMPTPQPVDPNAPITMNFKDASLRTVLDYLSESAGLVIIGDPKIEGRISVTSRRNISIREAVDVLNSALKDKGYAAVRIGARNLKILSFDDAIKESTLVRKGIDPDEIEPTDQIVTQVIPIRNADAVKLKADLAPFIPSSANIASNASSNTLILTGTQAVVRRVVEIVRAIDVEMMVDVSQVRVYPLKNANATNTAKLITDIFKDPTQSQPQQPGGGGGRRQFIFPGMPQQPADEKGAKNTKVTASADDRTNTLVVSAAPEVLKVIDSMIAELEKDPANPNAVFIYHLKNADATNLAGVLNNVFSATGSTSGTNYNPSSSSRTTGTSSSPFGSSSGSSRNTFGSSSGSSSFGLNNSSRTSSSTLTRPGTTTGGPSGSGSTLGSRGQPGMGTGSTSDLLGQVFVVPDTATNSLVVTTASKNFKQVTKIIDDLDHAVPQVLIKVLICEVTHTNTVDLGVEFSGLNLSGANAVQGLSVGQQVTNTPVIEGKGESGASSFNVVNNTTGGFLFKLDEKYVTAAVHALSQLNKVNVLSRPYILTSDNQEATIMVGENDPFITSSQITTDGQVINNIQYQAIGIILDVTPHINGQGQVTLDVYPEISANTGRTVPLNQFASSPIFSQRYAQSRVAIRDGQTIVIGGMMQDELTKEIDKIPFLGDIPVLGVLFQHSNEVKQKTELLIFLTPHVAKEPGELKGMTESEKSGTKIVQDAVDTGAYKNHLKGMELGASSRPASGPSAWDNPVHTFDDDSATTRPAGKDSPTSQPAGEIDGYKR